MTFQYTQGQGQCLDKLSNFIGSDQPVFCLSGSAGTGKTTLSQEVPNMVTRGRFIGTAPTHKAVGVQASKMSEDVECMTIHKFLGLKPYKKGDVTPLKRKVNYDPSEYYDVKVVGVDEASMVNEELLKFMLQDAKDWSRQYVLLGDRYQLPPVNSLSSPCFDLPLGDYCKHELTEIMRHAGPIITTATNIRDAIIKGVQPDITTGLMEDGTGVRMMNTAKWEAALMACASRPEFREDPDFARVVAYRNDTVATHSQTIRGFLGEPLDVPFCPGDLLTANEAWIQNDEVIFNTGTEWKVTAMEPHQHPLYPALKGWQVWVEGITEMPIYVLDIINCRSVLKVQLGKLAESAKGKGGSWSSYYELSEFYADLRPCGSITCHKSQGSTFQNVFVDLKDIYKNGIQAEADRCLYVAVTRASKNVFIRY